MDERLQNIIEALSELLADNTVPRNIKSRVQEIINIVQNTDEDVSMKINRALSELDEIAEDANLQSYTRTQIWNIVSMLEMI